MMEKEPVYPREGRTFILLQHISEGWDFSIGDQRRQAETVGSALKGLWYALTGKYPHEEDRRLVVVEAGSGQGRLHPYLKRYLGPNVNVIGIEKHPEAVNEGKKRDRELIQGDYTHEGP